MNSKSPFANWLLEQMKKQGLTQADLARASSLTPTAVSDVINGKRNPGFDFCKQIARPLEIPPEQVLQAAGLWPEKSKTNKMIDQINYMVSELPEGEQQDILEFIKMRTRIIEEKDGRKKEPRGKPRIAPS